MTTLKDTVALVTGASSGIGRETVKSLAGSGASVGAVARRADRLESLAAEIDDGGGGTILPIECDITQREQIRDAVSRTIEEFGRLDVLINNAGVMLLGDFAEADEAEWQEMVEVNLLGSMHFTRECLPHLRAAAQDDVRGVADVVNVSSVAGRVTRAGGAVYNATKTGICAFTESLRQEVTGEHVRIGMVEPGVVDTELFSHNQPGILDKIGSRFGDLERLLPSDIAGTINYMVTQPRRVAINEVLIRPTEQADKAG